MPAPTTIQFRMVLNSRSSTRRCPFGALVVTIRDGGLV
jgi:hypothetical protein